MDASVAVALVAVGLSFILLALYRKIFQQTRTRFGIALSVFAAAFLVQSCFLVYAYLTMMPVVPESTAPFLFGTSACEATGLSAMLWTATR